MNAKAAILNRIKSSLNKQSDESDRQQEVAKRLASPLNGPERQLLASPVDLFKQKLTQVAATYDEVDNHHDLIKKIENYLAQHEMPAKFVCSTHELLDVDWPGYFNVTHGAAENNDKVAISVAYAAIAETGSLVLLSSIETPTTLNFMPDYYLCVVMKKQVLMTMESLWDMYRLEFNSMPRALNIITGPSRTADVEQTIQLGAHGPRQLHVILLNN